MPWEITVHAGPGGFGDGAALRDRIVERWPGTEWHLQASFAELVAARSDHPLAAYLATDDGRAVAHQRRWRGVCERGDVFVEILGCDDIVEELALWVRGSVDPLPLLRLLCEPAGWTLTDDASGRAIDLRADDDPGWRSFADYRDRVTSKKP